MKTKILVAMILGATCVVAHAIDDCASYTPSAINAMPKERLRDSRDDIKLTLKKLKAINKGFGQRCRAGDEDACSIQFIHMMGSIEKIQQCADAKRLIEKRL